MKRIRRTICGLAVSLLIPETGIMRLNASAIASVIALLAVSAASADTFSLTATGTWATACPAVYCSAIGDTWTYSFDFNTSFGQNPALPELDSSFIEYTYNIQLYDNSGLVYSFEPTGSEGSGTGEGAYFINPAGPVGQFGSLWDPYVGVQLFTGSLYQVGTEFNPVFNTGFFPITEAIVENTNTGDVSGITFTDLTTSSTPEPSGWDLALGGVALLSLRRKRKED